MRKILKVFAKTYYERMKVKIKQEMVLVGLMAGLAMQGWAVGFDSNPNRRVEAPHLRKESTAQKSPSVYYFKSQSEDGETTTSSRRRRRQTTLQEKSSLLPEGFDADDSTSAKTSSEANKVPKKKVLSAEGQSLKDDIKVEYGEGHGETFDEALKEAMKDVLQKVVGVYVDSDFRMNNDEIIKDEIITHSNGFIDHYKKMEESNDTNGRGKVVTIKAWVKMRDFVNRMKKIAPKQTVKVDGALLDNDVVNKINAESLLKKEIESLNPAMDLMEVKLVENIRPVVRKTTDETVTLRYVFQFRYSKVKYYQEFIPRISRVLDQISEAKPRDRCLNLTVQKANLLPADNINSIGAEGWTERPVIGFCLRPKNYWYGGCANDTPKPKSCVSAITMVTKGGAANVREWRLSERLIDIYNDCRQRYCTKCKNVSCILTLSDGDGNVLSQSSCRLSEEWYLPKWDIQFDFSEQAIDFIPFIRMWGFDIVEEIPNFYFGSNDWLDRYVGCIDIVVDRDDVAKIKAAEVKIETND